MSPSLYSVPDPIRQSLLDNPNATASAATVPTAPEPRAEHPATNPRKRGRTACTRCKTRKQKCDDQWPVCSNCQKAGSTCDKLAVTEDEPPAAYTRALEERIALLEMKLLAATTTRSSPRQTRVDDDGPSHPSGGHNTAQHHSGQRDNNSSSNVLGEVVDVLEMGNFEAPAYVGASSGFGLALNLGHMVQATVWNKAMPTTVATTAIATTNTAAASAPADYPSAPGVREERSNSFSSGVATKAPPTMEDLIANSAEPPGDELGAAILNAYFTQLHVRYPFLHPDEIWALHAERFVLRATPVQDLTRPQRYGLFKLYLLYAIGSMLVRLTEKTATPPPESYYMAALQHIFAAKESRTVQNIEAMLLLVLYHLRSASNHGIWYMIGLAMRTCIDLGLHRKKSEAGYHRDPLQVQLRRRLFWSIYVLERVIAISLGRPFSIPDRQIDVDLPDEFFNTTAAAAAATSTYEEDANGNGKDNGPRPPRPSSSSSPSSSHCSCSASPASSTSASSRPSTTAAKGPYGSLWSPATLAVLLIEVRRIESRIQYSIYRADKPLAALMSKVEPIYQELQGWKQAAVDKLEGSSNPRDLHYAMLHYHKATWLLIQPFLPLLSFADGYYQACIRAAGKVCQTHKQLHQSLDYGHSFIAVQTVFVSGITLLYALWTHQRDVWSVTLANDIRACSLVLFVMGERAPWVRKYRDAFELLVSATMEKLENGGRSDLLAQTAEAATRCGFGGGGGGVGGRTRRPSSQQQQHGHGHGNANGMNGMGFGGGGGGVTGSGSGSGNGVAGASAGGMMNGMTEEAWRVVAELTSWIDQSDGSPVWMPDFESLHSPQRF